MAASSYLISLNYNNSIKKAEELLIISKRIGECSNRLIDDMGRIHYEWSGESSDRFISKINTIAGNLHKIETDIYNVSEVVKRVSNRTYASEMKAIEISKKRNYSGGSV